ncbi:hypothetical protein HOY82DRAFT_457567, partial [Tuber indicum]
LQQPNQMLEELPVLKHRVAAIREGQVILEQRVALIEEEQTTLRQGITAIKEGLSALMKGSILNLSLFSAKVINSATGLSDKNSVARLINHNVNDGNTPLAPFYGVNGQLIPDFPETAGQVVTLEGDRVDSLLLALDLEVTGSLTARRARFATHIGIR